MFTAIQPHSSPQEYVLFQNQFSFVAAVFKGYNFNCEYEMCKRNSLEIYIHTTNTTHCVINFSPKGFKGTTMEMLPLFSYS